MNARQRRLIRTYAKPPFALTVYKFDLWLVRLALLAIIVMGVRGCA